MSCECPTFELPVEAAAGKEFAQGGDHPSPPSLTPHFPQSPIQPRQDSSPAPAVVSSAGSAKGVTAAKTRGLKYIRNRGYGGSIMTAVPNLSGVEAPAGATVVLSASAMTFTLASIPSDVTNLKLVIQASDPQGNGITRAYSKADAFDDPYTPVATAIYIKAKYDAKCGAPSVGSPKVFFKYFFLNN